MPYLITAGSSGSGMCMGHGPNGSPMFVKVFVTSGTSKLTVLGSKVCVVTTKIKTTCPRCGKGTANKGLKKVMIGGQRALTIFPLAGIKLHGSPGSKVFRLNPIIKKVAVPFI